MKVFLGGTCNGSTWRDELIPMLRMDYFNPVVEDWTPECQAEEVRQRQECDFVLYTITKEMKGVYSIAEVIDDSNKRPEKTVLCLLLDGFDEAQAKSLKAVGKLAHENGAHVCLSLMSAALTLNTAEVIESAA
ncbi:MAG TPA: nucleoside 2-deoxyribosyltransferase domain-containing protein [Candidatus Binatia bacterium]|nr:nucleoside 2-deoxyribosyltransferase domain-containing protein [Candidatus Binatia bacterium]